MGNFSEDTFAPQTKLLIQYFTYFIYFERQDISDLNVDYDWTYTTKYDGAANREWEPTQKTLNMNLLMRRDPILWHTTIVFFEDGNFSA